MPELEQVINSLGTEVHELIEKTKSTNVETSERLTAVEQRLSKSTVYAGGDGDQPQSIGAKVIEAEQFKAFIAQGQRNSGRIPVGSFFPTKSTILTDGYLYSLPTRVPTIQAVYLPLRVRDLLTASPCTSNTVEFVRESSSTNAAAPQGYGSSPQVYEGIAKAESAMVFQLMKQPVVTLAHWIPASRQVLDDSAALANFINRRMLYFLKLKEEDELLNGTGSGGDLDGLMHAASIYQGPSPIPLGETKLDSIRRAIGQVEAAGFSATGVVVNPVDWTDICLIKESGTYIFSGEYIYSDPHAAGPPSVWGRPLVVSSKMAAGEFLVGDFSTAGAELWDRMQSSIEISFEHLDFFTTNKVAILAEERLALTVYQANAFVAGSF
jgi:HK97 family phage major capsid protein